MTTAGPRGSGVARQHRRRAFAPTVMLAMLLVATVLASCNIKPANFIVNTGSDANDANVGDGVCEATPGVGDCTLRAAISESNALPSKQIIEIAGGANPTLSLAGAGEDGNATGDLDITDDLDIRGGQNQISGAGLDRVFDVDPTSGGHTVTVADARVTNGHGDVGGGIRLGGSSTATLHRLAFVGNSADLEGGAVHAAPGTTVTIRNSTLTNNAAPFGSAAALAGTANLWFTTVVANSGATAVQRNAGTTNVVSSIIANQTSGANCGPVLTSGGYNIESSTSCGLATPSDRTDTDPSLEPFNPAGYYPPTPASPAVNAVPIGEGMCESLIKDDQRAQVRPSAGACEIGAVELYPAPPTVPGSPTGVTASPKLDMLGSVDLSWSPPESDGGAPIDHYQVSVTKDEGATWTALDAPTASPTVASCGIAGTTCRYVVSAHNAAGYGPAAQSNAVFMPLSSPFIVCGYDPVNADGLAAGYSYNLLTYDATKPPSQQYAVKPAAADKFYYIMGTSVPTCGAASTTFKGTADGSRINALPWWVSPAFGNGFSAITAAYDVPGMVMCPPNTETFNGCGMLIPIATQSQGSGTATQLKVVIFTIWQVWGSGGLYDFSGAPQNGTAPGESCLNPIKLSSVGGMKYCGLLRGAASMVVS